MDNFCEFDDDKRHTLEVMLKKLGISNVDKHIEQMNREMRSNSLRHNRQSSSISSKSKKDNNNNKLKANMVIKPKRKYTRRIKTEDSRGENGASLSSMLMFAKNRKRTSESDDDVKKNSNMVARKKIMSIDSNLSSCSSSQHEIDEENELYSQIDESCTFSGCDSTGHLSGAFNHHTSNETCPKFHNQTNEDCLKRFKRRKEMFRKKKNIKSPNKSSPMKRSPSKKKDIAKVRNLKTDIGWTKVMDDRKKELSSLNHGKEASKKSTHDSNSEPNLDGYTPKFDLELFKESQSRAAELMHFNLAGELRSEKEDSELLSADKPADQTVVFGQHELDVWYSSPYSNEFQNCKTLFICEFCLKCMSSPLILERHAFKCELKHPPGIEIYRKDDLSFFEVDGNKQKEYCQNLCLFAKLFLNHKTLFFDVEPFLFYIMTVKDDNGMHIVGYFSKEKVSSRDYNVSCILTIPAFQRSGYGRMLIDFSYLLTRAEGKVGSPETPISDLGIISYRSYWKFVIMDYLCTFQDKNISLKDMSQQTGVNSNDIVSTLQLMGLLKYWKGEHLILLPDDIRHKFTLEIKRKRKQFGKKFLDPKQLKWTKPIVT